MGPGDPRMAISHGNYGSFGYIFRPFFECVAMCFVPFTKDFV
jgi:hypothetical protein